MKRLHLVVASFSLVLWFFTACQGTETIQREEAFAELYPAVSLNQSLKLANPVLLQDNKPLEFSIGDLVELDLINLSDNVIRFPVDLGLEIYTYDDQTNRWNSVENAVEYKYDSHYFLLNSKDTLPFFADVPLYPVLPMQNEPIVIRVVVIGEVLRNGEPSGEQTGAYVDVTMMP